MLSSTELALFERLLDVGKLLERRADAATRREIGLKYAQYEVLIRLRNAGGEMRMTELARKLVSSPSRLTYQVDQLEKDGLVTRASAPDDERGVLAQITDRGRTLLHEVAGTQNDMIVTAVVKPLEPAEVDALAGLLGTLQVHLRGELTGGQLPD
jgi:DNA-binding MarR family transcriptional regulator